MDIQARKIHFVQEFLRLRNEGLIDKFEKLLRLEKMKIYELELSSMTIEQLNTIIDNAEEDSKNGRMTSASQLRNEINSWT
ncbi:hypothetical protein ACT3CD_12055 [Geofilum sp. OHC36d9]|uniref:hypothetical protein n=1 Tax=Geofilum sp. OHC36d9 TaxID=3458413 RepID=UPI004033FEF7